MWCYYTISYVVADMVLVRQSHHWYYDGATTPSHCGAGAPDSASGSELVPQNPLAYHPILVLVQLHHFIYVSCSGAGAPESVIRTIVVQQNHLPEMVLLHHIHCSYDLHEVMKTLADISIAMDVVQAENYPITLADISISAGCSEFW